AVRVGYGLSRFVRDELSLAARRFRGVQQPGGRPIALSERSATAGRLDTLPGFRFVHRQLGSARLAAAGDSSSARRAVSRADVDARAGWIVALFVAAADRARPLDRRRNSSRRAGWAESGRTFLANSRSATTRRCKASLYSFEAGGKVPCSGP